MPLFGGPSGGSTNFGTQPANRARPQSAPPPHMGTGNFEDIYRVQYGNYAPRDINLRDTLEGRFLGHGGRADEFLGASLPGGSYYDAMLAGLPYLTGGAGGSGGGGGSASGGGINTSGRFDEPAAIYRGLGQGMQDNLLRNTANMFMQTGGFQGDELNSMRRASLAPTRAIYQNAADRANRMGATTGNPYAGFGRMSREQNDALSNIATQTEANIAGLVQQGRLSGVQAKTAINELDAQMRAMGAGGLTDIEKAKLQADLQNASLNESAAGRSDAMNRAIAQYYQQAAGAGFDEAQFRAGLEQFGLGGALNLYGTAPGATQASAQNMLQNRGLDIQDRQSRQGQGGSGIGNILGGIGGLFGGIGELGGFGALFSNKKYKDELEPVKDMGSKIANMNIYNWNYKGDKTKHIGPEAEEFTKLFGVGDGDSINLFDMMGVVLSGQKEILSELRG